MTRERLSWIDIAKGIGILLVIYGHGLNGDSIRYIIYAFHMPLFFFLSGIVFHHKKHEHFMTFLKKDIKSIILPYFLFAFVSLLIAYLNVKPELRSTAELLLHAKSILYANGTNGNLSFNVVLWFLPCLFVTRVGFWMVTKFSQTRRIVFTLLLSSLIGYAITLLFPSLKLPLSIEVAFTAVVFFGAGYLWNGQSEGKKLFFKKHALSFSLLFLLICILTATLSYTLYEIQIDLRLNRINSYGLFYAAAFSGIFATLAFSLVLHKNRILEALGKRSMVFFVWHLIVFSYITLLLRTFLTPQTIDSLRNFYLAPLYTVVSMSIIIMFSLLLCKLRRLFSLKQITRKIYS